MNPHTKAQRRKKYTTIGVPRATYQLLVTAAHKHSRTLGGQLYYFIVTHPDTLRK